VEIGHPAAGPRPNRAEPPIRAAELVAALSIATDLGTGQPLEHALRTAVLAVRIGELAGASAADLSDTYYVALLHASGCTSNGHEAAQLFGDDITHRAAFYLVDPTKPEELVEFYRANVGVGRSPEVRARMVEDADHAVAGIAIVPGAREAVSRRARSWTVTSRALTSIRAIETSATGHAAAPMRLAMLNALTAW
jgi:hypothetical protein